MKCESNTPKPPRWPAYRRIPAFLPVPLRARRDGWSPILQCWFIGALAESGSVSAAAAYVHRSRESAYRLRRQPGAGGFAHAWDAVLAIRGGIPIPARKFTQEELWRIMEEGELQVRMVRSRYHGTERKSGTWALMKLWRAYRRAGSERRRERRMAAAHSGPFRSTNPAPFAPSRRPAIAAGEDRLEGFADGC